MRRTLADARRSMEQELIPGSSDYVSGQAKAFLEEQERKATKAADSYISERERELVEVRNTALRELAEVRDQLEDLASEGRTGRIPAEHYTSLLHDLRERQAQAEAQLAKGQEQVEAIEQIEEDPIAWFDSLTQRQPHMRMDFPW
jgi:hypothetical protein